jgi:hypothetical protein
MTELNNELDPELRRPSPNSEDRAQTLKAHPELWNRGRTLGPNPKVRVRCAPNAISSLFS